MCQFFSFVSDGKGRCYWFDWNQRLDIMSGKIKVESADSHTSIASYYGFTGSKKDTLNKYEYNPLTKQFTIDQINAKDENGFKLDDSDDVKKIVSKLDFKKIVKPLIIKKIVNPFKNRITKPTESDKKLLKQWTSVCDIVLDSVGDSVRDSVGYSVRDSVGYSVWDIVLDSVRYSVWDSVRYSVGAYISTFFDIEYKHDFSSCIKLWNRGLVPSFDGKTWRLHSGKNSKIVYKWTP